MESGKNVTCEKNGCVPYGQNCVDHLMAEVSAGTSKTEVRLDRSI